MKYRKFTVHSLILAFLLVMIAGTTGSAASPGDAKIREAIDRTQTLQAAITRCMSSDDKACGEGVAMGKLAKEAADKALDQSDLKDGARSNLRAAIEHLNSINIYLSNARASEALPITNSALNALYEADKAS